MEKLGNESREHQAEKLMELFQEVSNHAPDNETMRNETKQGVAEEYIELDVLNLPPRREIHQKSKQRLTIRWREPIVRMFFVLVLLLTILVVLYFTIGDRLIFFH